MKAELTLPSESSTKAPPGSQPRSPFSDLDTTQFSLIHKTVRYDGQAWRRNTSSYAISVAATYGVMCLIALLSPQSAGTEAGPVRLSFFHDWNIVYTFCVSFPAILFLVASDQSALITAMSRVWEAGVVKTTEGEAKALATDWTAKFKRINIVAQCLGLVVAIFASRLTLQAYLTNHAGFWADPGGPLRPIGYAYLLYISFFYTLLAVYVVRCIAMARLLQSLATRCTISISALHPDGCGGLQPLGRVGLRNQYALSILGLNIAALAAVSYDFLPVIIESYIIVPAAILYLVLGPIVFLGPLIPFRGLMGRLKRGLMQEVAVPLAAEFDRMRTDLRAQRTVSKEQMESLERLRSMGQLVGELPIWPFDFRTMRTFAAAYVVPVALAVLTKLVEVFIVHAAS